MKTNSRSTIQRPRSGQVEVIRPGEYIIRGRLAERIHRVAKASGQTHNQLLNNALREFLAEPN